MPAKPLLRGVERWRSAFTKSHEVQIMGSSPVGSGSVSFSDSETCGTNGKSISCKISCNALTPPRSRMNRVQVMGHGNAEVKIYPLRRAGTRYRSFQVAGVVRPTQRGRGAECEGRVQAEQGIPHGTAHPVYAGRELRHRQGGADFGQCENQTRTRRKRR